MGLALVYSLVETWPPLAWLAQYRYGDDVVAVAHGAMVETTDDWFCEAIWDGEYQAGGFDDTDNVFGSGGRLRGDSITFVTSSATVDRIQHVTIDGVVYVSNSLACLMAACGLRVDPGYTSYIKNFGTIVLGLERYRDTIQALPTPVQLLYYQNLLITKTGLRKVPKPFSAHDLRTYADYVRFMDTSLARLGQNLRDSRRSNPYAMMGTLSSGYDSPTVAVLARPHGLKAAISFVTSRSGEDDSGTRVAQILGLDIHTFGRDAWRTGSLPEAPFLASDGKGEDVYFASAAHILRGRVLLTGYQGDKLWGKDDGSPDHAFVRVDQAGLSLTEYRLHAGFINCPVPFMSARYNDAVTTISRAEEMAPWDVPRKYSRPICRRVVETAGVPRELFGTSKKAASVLFHENEAALTAESAEAFAAWFRETVLSSRRYRARYQTLVAESTIRRTVFYGPEQGLRLLASLPVKSGRLTAVRNRVAGVAWRDPLSPYYFAWAMDHVTRAYERA